MSANPRGQRRRQPVRTPQPRRPGTVTARTQEPPDYTRDYDDVRRDLILITLISLPLFLGMIGLSFVI